MASADYSPVAETETSLPVTAQPFDFFKSDASPAATLQSVSHKKTIPDKINFFDVNTMSPAGYEVLIQRVSLLRARLELAKSKDDLRPYRSDLDASVEKTVTRRGLKDPHDYLIWLLEDQLSQIYMLDRFNNDPDQLRKRVVSFFTLTTFLSFFAPRVLLGFSRVYLPSLLQHSLNDIRFDKLPMFTHAYRKMLSSDEGWTEIFFAELEWTDLEKNRLYHVAGFLIRLAQLSQRHDISDLSEILELADLHEGPDYIKDAEIEGINYFSYGDPDASAKSGRIVLGAKCGRFQFWRELAKLLLERSGFLFSSPSHDISLFSNVKEAMVIYLVTRCIADHATKFQVRSREVQKILKREKSFFDENEYPLEKWYFDISTPPDHVTENNPTRSTLMKVSRELDHMAELYGDDFDKTISSSGCFDDAQSMVEEAVVRERNTGASALLAGASLVGDVVYLGKTFRSGAHFGQWDVLHENMAEATKIALASERGFVDAGINVAIGHLDEVVLPAEKYAFILICGAMKSKYGDQVGPLLVRLGDSLIEGGKLCFVYDDNFSRDSSDARRMSHSDLTEIFYRNNFADTEKWEVATPNLKMVSTHPVYAEVRKIKPKVSLPSTTTHSRPSVRSGTNGIKFNQGFAHRNTKPFLARLPRFSSFKLIPSR